MERDRQARWDAANLRTASTKMRAAEYRMLQDACALEETTVYNLVRRLLQGWLVDFARKNPSAAEDIMRPR